MSEPTLEARVAALERIVDQLVRQQPAAGATGPDPTSRWWETVPPLSPEAAQAWDEMAPYREYIRKTGDTPPPGWKPGDPIPDPDHWG